MKLGWTLIYVEDVAATVAFYESAFKLHRRFVHESGLFAEMQTGETTLGFAANTMAELNGLRIRPNTQWIWTRAQWLRPPCRPPTWATRRRSTRRWPKLPNTAGVFPVSQEENAIR